jgi:hypothetical protein
MVRRFRSLAAPLVVLWFAAGLPAAAQEAQPQQAQQAQQPEGDPAQIDAKVKAEVERQLKEREAQQWTAGITPQGGGVFLKSPDGQALFRLYGYAQPTFTYTDKDNGLDFGQTDFSVRRARLDFSADYQERYKLFIEVDAAPSDGTSLVEAYVQAAYVKDREYLRLGKFVTPFSTENQRSSRSLDTVERYLALDAAFSLPALDVQFGSMLWGYLDPGKKVTYYLGAWNGNSSAGAAVFQGQNGNAHDNNSAKDYQGRLNVQWTDSLTTGAAFDSDHEEGQTLTLASYSGGQFIGLDVHGQRRGYDLDAHWKSGRLSLDSEWLSYDFRDSDVKLDGGYAQAAFWACGSEATGGVQPLVRAEQAQLSGDALQTVDGRKIVAVTVGANVWFNGWTRWQINLIGEHFDGRGNGAFTAGSGWRPTVLNQLQIKF